MPIVFPDKYSSAFDRASTIRIDRFFLSNDILNTVFLQPVRDEPGLGTFYLEQNRRYTVRNNYEIISVILLIVIVDMTRKM